MIYQIIRVLGISCLFFSLYSMEKAAPLPQEVTACIELFSHLQGKSVTETVTALLLLQSSTGGMFRNPFLLHEVFKTCVFPHIFSEAQVRALRNFLARALSKPDLMLWESQLLATLVIVLNASESSLKKLIVDVFMQHFSKSPQELGDMVSEFLDYNSLYEHLEQTLRLRKIGETRSYVDGHLVQMRQRFPVLPDTSWRALEFEEDESSLSLKNIVFSFKDLQESFTDKKFLALIENQCRLSDQQKRILNKAVESDTSFLQETLDMEDPATVGVIILVIKFTLTNDPLLKDDLMKFYLRLADKRVLTLLTPEGHLACATLLSSFFHMAVITDLDDVARQCIILLQAVRCSNAAFEKNHLIEKSLMYSIESIFSENNELALNLLCKHLYEQGLLQAKERTFLLDCFKKDARKINMFLQSYTKSHFWVTAFGFIGACSAGNRGVLDAFFKSEKTQYLLPFCSAALIKSTHRKGYENLSTYLGYEQK